MSLLLNLLFFFVLVGAVVYLLKEIQILKSEGLKFRYLERALMDQRDSIEKQLKVTRTHLAAVAQGQAPPVETIIEGLPYADITVEQAQRLLAEQPDTLIVDVRTPSEYQGGALPGAKNVPINSLEVMLSELPDKGRPLLVYCASGARSSAACEILASKGYTKLYHLPSGYFSWPAGAVAANSAAGA